ncbi:hypothetical protein D9611_004330 [Ephemerocybe angulata]|uniref:RRM domain-containing protein n=1 Tax=Ephemerocybe angulata TaxID=980116 RepID=A0A8H5BJI6_9AGAR|nr:hypothetical protein D9611_004330 [Tulosesus angulatus]
MNLNFRPLNASLRKKAQHLLIQYLPPFTTPQDLKYALVKHNVPGIKNIAPIYKRFRPADAALVTLASPNHLQEAMQRLRRFEITGLEASPEPIIPPEEWLVVKRNRGHQGRKEASERGIMDGTGPWAGLGGSKWAEKAVVLTGFPGTTPVATVGDFLEGYGVSESKGEKMIYKIPLPPHANTIFSKFLVLMNTGEDAQQVFRELNQKPLLSRKQHLIQAQLIY